MFFFCRYFPFYLRQHLTALLTWIGSPSATSVGPISSLAELALILCHLIELRVSLPTPTPTPTPTPFYPPHFPTIGRIVTLH